MSPITSKSIRSRRARGDRQRATIPRGIAALCLAAALVIPHTRPAATPQAAVVDPFAWLQPAITIDASMRGRLDRGDVVSRMLPAPDGQVAVLLIGRLAAAPDRLEEWAESIADLKRSAFVVDVRRFSNPPALADLDTLDLDADDVDAAGRCMPGSCTLKISASDIELLRQAATDGDADRVRRQFREVVLSRVGAFEAEGFAGLSPYADRRKPSDVGAVAASLLAESPYLQSGPLADPASVTSQFYYWSKEQYGAGKRTITVTHVDIVRPAAPCPVRVAVIGREIFASHYRNGSLGLTAVVEDDTGARYLVYVNRTQLDMLGGIFRVFKRSVVEGRLGDESVKVFEGVRDRLETGPPPRQVNVATPRPATPDRSPAQ